MKYQLKEIQSKNLMNITKEFDQNLLSYIFIRIIVPII